MTDSDEAQEAQQNHTLRSLMKGNILVLTVSRARNTRGRIMAALGQGINIGVSGGSYVRGFILFIPATIGAYFGGYIYDYNPILPWILQAAILIVSIAMTYVYIKEPETAQV